MSCHEINNLRIEGKLVEAYQLAYSEYLQSIGNDGICHDADLIRAFFWVCVDMVKESKDNRNGTELAIMDTLQTLYREIGCTKQIETDAYGWSLCRLVADGMENMGALACRKLLAEYFDIGTARPSHLHSYALRVASNMAVLFPDFQFLPFLKLWDLRNLLPEDSIGYVDEKKGRQYPSLIDLVAKGYAHSFLFRDIDITSDDAYSFADNLLRPYLESLGYKDVIPMIATKVLTREVKGRNVDFVRLVGHDGTEAIAEIHKVTKYRQMRRNEVENTIFRVLLRKQVKFANNEEQKEKQSVESCIPSQMIGCEREDRERFGAAVGYVDSIDVRHKHIHIFDSNSRHFVAQGVRWNLSVGQYVEFSPVIPKESSFKSAVVTRVHSSVDGPTAFGLREVKVTYVDVVNGYCAWELVDCNNPIIEMGTSTPCYVKGYLSKQVIQARGNDMPKIGDVIKVVVYLRRGKDGLKRPWVAEYWKK